MHKRSFRLSRSGAPALSLHESGNGETVFLLIHGFGDGGFIWNEFYSHLIPFGRVIAVDLRGHGDSDWDESRQYGAAAHLADINFICDTLDLKKVVVIGHSMGGEVALRLAAVRPGCVVGLIIVDFGPELNRASTEHIRKEFVSESRIYDLRDEYAAHLAVKLPLADPNLCERLARNALRPNPGGGYVLKRDPAMGAANRQTQRNPLPALWPTLKNILCPVLIIRGVASSVLSPPITNRMIEVLSNGSLALIKFAGHAVMIDNPEEFAAASLLFIKKKLQLCPNEMLEGK